MVKRLVRVGSFFLPLLLAGPVLAVDPATTFKAQCASCHGETGKGDGPVGKLMSPPIPPLAACSPEIILKGKGRMPGFAGRLQPADADALCGYIRSLPK